MACKLNLSAENCTLNMGTPRQTLKRMEALAKDERFSAPLAPFMGTPNREILTCENDKGLNERGVSKKLDFEKNNLLQIFSSGRGAMFRIAEILKKSKCGTLSKSDAREKTSLFIPRYFCPNLAKQLEKFFEIKFYNALPSDNIPNFESVKNPAKGDLVLLVNFFGLGREKLFCAWDSFKSAHPELGFAEDFSHTPLCERISNFGDKKNSPPDFCDSFAFASLRKWLPLPEGGILKLSNPVFSKNIFRRPSSEMQGFASDSLAAANLSAFKGEVSENLFYSCEAKLNALEKYSRSSVYTFETIKILDFEKIAKRRIENLEIFYGASKGFLEKFGIEELNFKNSPPKDGFETFVPVLKFPNEKLRNSAYSKMRGKNIFCSIYWGNFSKAQASREVLEESGRILILPLDFRHSAADATRLADTLARAL